MPGTDTAYDATSMSYGDSTVGLRAAFAPTGSIPLLSYGFAMKCPVLTSATHLPEEPIVGIIVKVLRVRARRLNLKTGAKKEAK